MLTRELPSDNCAISTFCEIRPSQGGPMATFRDVGKDVQAMCKGLIAKKHPELAEAGVRVRLLFAHAPRDPQTDEPKGPAIRHHGYAAGGLAKINSHEKRVAGEDDCQITL